MNRDIEADASSAPVGKSNRIGNPKSHSGGHAPISLKNTSLDADPNRRAALLSLSLSLGGFVQDDPRVVRALEDYMEALNAGRIMSRGEFLAQHSEIADSLRECLSGLEFIHAASAQLSGSQPVSTMPQPNLAPPIARLGDYVILREVGRGGMGVVYEAKQLSLGRHVALKVLPFAAAIDPKKRQRFQIEAQAAAQLRHPHIVPIFSVGCEHEIHYYAMQYVEGRSLGALLHDLRHRTDDRPGPPGSCSGAPQFNQADNPASLTIEPRNLSLAFAKECDDRISDSKRILTCHSDTTSSATSGSASPCASFLVSTVSGAVHQDRAFFRTIARLGVEAAEALDHAHGLGILHRDIKPANLLIDRDGALWITDFGLARFASDLSLTHTGDMVGTLRYMSPEQALARRGVVDQRTDIYSLGATLYELLALRPAFDGRDHQELLRQIAIDEPTKPRRINPAIPRDLETIVLKAMAKDPSGRYATAQDLAADLKRFLDDRPILARRPGPVERSLRWAMRHRELVATTTAVLVVALIVSTAAIWAQARKTEAANNSLQDANRKHNVYIIETWPLLDGFAMEQMRQATMLINNQSDPAIREELMGTYRQAFKVYRQATQLPPVDLESRAIIAKAFNRMGFTNAMLSGAKGGKNGPEPSLLAQSETDYRQSLTLFERLYTEFPTDSKVRRFYAEALGTWGWGWFLVAMNRTDEARPNYEHSVKLLREQIREDGASDHGGTENRAKEGVTNVLSDLTSLASTVFTLANILESSGSTREASLLRRQLDDDINVLAAWFSDPERRQFWATQFMYGGASSLRQNNYLSAAVDFRLVTILNPDYAEAHNHLAWAMTCVPGQSTPFDIGRALDSARKAVALKPENWMYWNTLGVAAYRAKDWKLAAETLEKSIDLNSGGGAIDFFFLAMTRWHQGKPDEAKKLFDRAATYVQHNPGDAELQRFHREAKGLLSMPAPKADAEARHDLDNVASGETAESC
jgi:serine/threonine protein kinase